MSDRTPELVDAFSVVVAHAAMRRFEALVGGELVCSPIVFEAARQVFRVALTAETDPIAALDELEELERALQLEGGDAEAISSR